jgi:hypothetical protein
MLQLCDGLPVWRAQKGGEVRLDDEMQHVLRPHQHRQEADVRDRMPKRCTVFRYTRATRRDAAQQHPVNTFVFGKEVVRTKVYLMMPKGSTKLVIE